MRAEQRSGDIFLHPDFTARMQRLLGDEWGAFLSSYDRPPLTGLRVNELKLSPARFQAASPFELEPIPWCPAGFQVPGHSQPGKHPYHAAGLYYLQDPSAMAVAGALAPQAGETVLDLSAAPGGKSTHLAALLHHTGLLIANEVHPKRAWELAENLERWGARHAAVLNETPQRLAEHFGAFFDAVLVDAPCSGEGMFRKSEAARQEWSAALVESCAARQDLILQDAARLVRPGGRLVYATCTFSPAENEGTLSRFLHSHPDFEMEALPATIPGSEQGRPEWVPGAPGSLRLAARLWPHRLPGEGHFIARLRRRPGTSTASLRSRRPAPLPRAAREVYASFRQDTLLPNAPLSNTEAGHLLLDGAYLYQLAAGWPDLGQLRVLRPGWWLGELKKKRFEPSHALSLGLEAQHVQRSHNLAASSNETRAYLRGESLNSPGEDGWSLVLVDGYPLGWGKRVAGQIKNFYPRGLRWP